MSILWVLAGLRFRRYVATATCLKERLDKLACFAFLRCTSRVAEAQHQMIGKLTSMVVAAKFHFQVWKISFKLPSFLPFRNCLLLSFRTIVYSDISFKSNSTFGDGNPVWGLKRHLVLINFD